MKKLLAVCIIGLSLTAGAFAEHPSGWGLGILGRGGYGAFGPALSLKAPPLPIYWGISLSIWDSYFGLGVTGDYYIIDKALVPDINLDWYFGVGGYVSLGTWDHGPHGNGFGLAVGARVPLGLSWEFLEHFELFGNLNVSLGIGIAPKFYFPDWGGIGGEIGIRYWF